LADIDSKIFRLMVVGMKHWGFVRKKLGSGFLSLLVVLTMGGILSPFFQTTLPKAAPQHPGQQTLAYSSPDEFSQAYLLLDDQIVKNGTHQNTGSTNVKTPLPNQLALVTKEQAQYQQYALAVQQSVPGLTVRVLLFPFHGFW